MATAVQFGAGNIGRGFLGELFYRSGLETVFIEINEDLVKALNQARRYEIEIRDEAGNYPIPVGNVRAVLASDEDAVAEEVARAEIAATAVGVAALPQAAPNCQRPRSALLQSWLRASQHHHLRKPSPFRRLYAKGD